MGSSHDFWPPTIDSLISVISITGGVRSILVFASKCPSYGLSAFLLPLPLPLPPFCGTGVGFGVDVPLLALGTGVSDGATELAGSSEVLTIGPSVLTSSILISTSLILVALTSIDCWADAAAPGSVGLSGRRVSFVSSFTATYGLSAPRRSHVLSRAS